MIYLRIFCAHENVGKIIFFFKIKFIIGVSNVVEHACLCILFIVMSVFERKVQNDLK